MTLHTFRLFSEQGFKQIEEYLVADRAAQSRIKCAVTAISN